MQNPIHSLRHLVQEAALASTPERRATGIVSRVKSAMSVGVCSLYLADQDGVLTLVASDGLNPESVGKIRLNPGEGLVGRIAQDQHPLNLESASAHPQFRYFPESGEERFEAFLGAPVVHAGKLVGVLVVEQQARRKFSEEEESFVVTVAAHLGALSPDDFQPTALPAPDADRAPRRDRRLRGLSASPGVGIGRIVKLSSDGDLMSAADPDPDDPAVELERFRQAVSATLADLAAGKSQLGDLPPDLGEVFTVYELLLQGEDFTQVVETKIRTGSSAVVALRGAVNYYVTRFEQMEDPYFRSRAEDIHILGNRVYARLSAPVTADLPEDDQLILVGGVVSVADLAAIPTDRLAGIIASEGSVLSHTALLARALGVPAVMGTGHQGDLDLASNELAIVDGYQGQVVISPSPAVCDEFQRMIDQQAQLLEGLAALREEPAITPDGTRVRLLANTGLLADISPGLAHGAEGIGLYRSEIPFMIRTAFPSEDEQMGVYRTVLESYRGLPVHMRTLDVGGDKPLPYYPFHEENPALGWRGVRFTLDNTAVLMTQVRAMIRAAAGLDNLRIMIPMVSTFSEVETFVDLLDRACSQLEAEGIETTRPLVGIMAEVPAIASVLPFLGGMIDFISIGSNDLCQYLLAVDRNNAHVSGLFDHLHPGVLHVMEEILRHARAIGITASVCGDMAADPRGAVLLLGMGVDTLSMPAFSVPRIKWLVRNLPLELAREQLSLARTSPRPADTRGRIDDLLVSLGLQALIDPESAGPDTPPTAR